MTTFKGQALAGNVTAWQPGILDQPGWTETDLPPPGRDRAENTEHHALVRVFKLPGGFRLLVGRDLDERERLYHIVLVRRPLVGRHRAWCWAWPAACS